MLDPFDCKLKFWSVTRTHFVKYNPMNNHAMFCSNGPCGFGDEGWNMKSFRRQTQSEDKTIDATGTDLLGGRYECHRNKSL